MYNNINEKKSPLHVKQQIQVLSQIGSSRQSLEIDNGMFSRNGTKEVEVIQPSVAFQIQQTSTKDHKTQVNGWRQKSQLQLCFELEKKCKSRLTQKVFTIVAIASKNLKTYTIKHM